MPLINWKFWLKLKWIKYCVLSAGGANNADAKPNNIIFTIKDTKFYIPVVTLSAKYNQKLSKLLSKRFQKSVYWNEYKAKIENKNTTNKWGDFLQLNFVGVNRLLVLIYSNQDNNAKTFKTRRCYLPKGIIDNYNVIINGKKRLWLTHWFWKRYKETRKLTTEKGEDYATGCLLDYEYIKNNYRLIAIDLSKQKKLDVDPKAIQ